LQPLAASASAVASPIPEFEPVTMAVLLEPMAQSFRGGYFALQHGRNRPVAKPASTW
jgi:hypothetical protein